MASASHAGAGAGGRASPRQGGEGKREREREREREIGGGCSSNLAAIYEAVLTSLAVRLPRRTVFSKARASRGTVTVTQQLR